MAMTLEEKGKLRKTAKTASVVVMIACFAVSLVVLVVIVKRTGWFAVRSVVIQGLPDPDRSIADKGRFDEVEVRLITDAWLGRSLLTVKKKLLVYRLKEVPWIKDSKVSLVFPSTLKVILTPREAVALLNSRTEYGFSMYCLDAEGVIMFQFGSGRAADRPVITGLELRNLYTGEKVALPELNRLLKVLGWLKKDMPGLYAEIEEINFENAYGVIRYKMVLTRWNIPVKTLRLDRDFFSALGSVLEHRRELKDLQGIRSMTCLSNMIFVETRGLADSAPGVRQHVRKR